MSAITGRASEAIGRDNIRRYRTTCKVLVDSHVTGKHNVSQDVVGMSISKNIKGIGQAKFALVARNNYLSYIHPGDYINIYFDTNDGAGWTRTFFGMVDRVEETYKVDNKGTPKTSYTIYCSDFQKAFERTNIYFNPHVVGREDFAGEQFGVVNVGGLALMTKGIRASGSPADIVKNLLILMYGFGSQFVLKP